MFCWCVRHSGLCSTHGSQHSAGSLCKAIGLGVLHKVESALLVCFVGVSLIEGSVLHKVHSIVLLLVVRQSHNMAYYLPRVHHTQPPR